MVYKWIVTVLLVVLNIESVAQSGSDTPINKDTILELVPAVPTRVSARVDHLFKKKPLLAVVLSGVLYTQKIPGATGAPLSMNVHALSRRNKKLFLKPFKKKLSRVGLHATRQKKNPFQLLRNFIVPLDGDLFIKASGLSNRRANIVSEMGGGVLTQATLDDFMSHHGGHTYQTLSRMVYWLRAKKAQKELRLDRICLPKKYLVHIPGRPTYADDTNYVVVAEKLHTKPILETDLLGDERVVAQIAHVILAASMWDIHAGNLRATKDNKACFIDFEQPGDFRPSDFGQDIVMERGIAKLNALIQKYGNKAKKNVSHLYEVTRNLLAAYCVSRQSKA